MTTRSHPGLLEIRDLSVLYGKTEVLHHVSLDMSKGESVAVVGESGSGKSTLLRAIAGLLPATAAITTGSILYQGEILSAMNAPGHRQSRRRTISYLFQNGQDSFDPLFTVGYQFDEALRARGVDPGGGTQTGLLEKMGIDDPDRVLASLASELSGGLCQRVALAVALAGSPELLLADEPTSSLDVDNQQNVRSLLERSNAVDGISLLVVTHDIKFAASLATRMVVMHDGAIVEEGPSTDIMHCPEDAYTKDLIDSIPTRQRVYRSIGI